ncbi:ComEC/Rec2 family competence protein, partial [Dyella sp.]|uniref:ComEC/Rec2 family competence protein n=1 Tax=Dyella sp. TaxID=1869338 RepID=UPI0032162877
MPVLPPKGWAAALLVLMVWLAWYSPRARVVSFVMMGAAWAAWCGARAMESRLPLELEGRDLVVVGTVAGLPQVREEATRFLLKVEQASVSGEPVALNGMVRIAWYATARTAIPAIVPCTRWRLVLRLKRPRGLVNPGGADGERGALERGIVATGYVRDGPSNESLGTPWCIDGWRAAIADGIAQRVADVRAAALLRAFAVGDTRGLSQHDWEVARANGASHLIAISGFHVGVAAVAGVALVRVIYILWPGFGLRLPRRQMQAMAALGFAALYSALAGFGLPTVRTLLMIAVVALARCSRRHVSPAQSLALALFAMLAVDPLSVLSAGFWLSF